MNALLEVWWKPIAVAIACVIVFLGLKAEQVRVEHLHATIAELNAQLEMADAKIKQQNQAIDTLKAAGKEQQETIEGLAKEAQQAAGRVEVQWKTKYVPMPIPQECTAAVSAGAKNASAAARLFIASTSIPSLKP